MANVYTTFATEQLAATLDGSERPTETLSGGSVNTIQVTRTYAASQAATADPLFLVRLPKGARVIRNACCVDHEATGTSNALTGNVGYIYDDGTGDADAYALNLALGATAGTKQFHAYNTTAYTAPVTLAAPAWVYVTWGTVTHTTPTAHTQTWTISYTLA
jgi:hypothetical protein